MSENEGKERMEKGASGERAPMDTALSGAGEARAKGPGVSTWALSLAIASLLGLSAISTAAYFILRAERQGLQELEQRLAKASEEQVRLTAKLGELHDQVGAQGVRIGQQQTMFDEYAQMFRSESDRYELGRKEIQESVNGVLRRLGRSTSRWRAAEAEYLIRVANHRVQLENDVSTALSALMAADERLRDSGDPLWTPVRGQLAEDIAALQAIVPLDREGLSARLNALSKQVEKLKLSEAVLSHQQKTGEHRSKQEFSLDRILQDGLKGFRSLMVVRRHDKPVAAMLLPEQEFFLGQNMRLQLESARLALLRADQHLYDDSLRSVKEWLEGYYDAEDPVVAAMRQGLAELIGVRVRPELPDISAALALIKKKAAEADAATPSQVQDETSPETKPPFTQGKGEALTHPAGNVAEEKTALPLSPASPSDNHAIVAPQPGAVTPEPTMEVKP